jgi:hypothetical protein
MAFPLVDDAMASAMEPPTFTADPVVDNTLDQAIILRDWVGAIGCVALGRSGTQLDRELET